MNNQKFITFFKRFVTDITSNKKTITIRDDEAKYYHPGDIVDAYTFEERIFFAKLKILSVTPLKFNEIDVNEAKQENMTVEQLKKVIKDIYPDKEDFYTLTFRCL